MTSEDEIIVRIFELKGKTRRVLSPKRIRFDKTLGNLIILILNSGKLYSQYHWCPIIFKEKCLLKL